MDTNSAIWPNFYIVGGVKSGTTSLWAYLKSHPQVFLPKVKEPRYFGEIPSKRRAELTEQDLARYQELFRGSEGFKAVGDCSPQYLEDPLAAKRIHDVCPTGRIIMILRDPVERAYAQYLMPAGPDVEVVSFDEALRRDWNMGSSNGNGSKSHSNGHRVMSGDQSGTARALELPRFYEGVQRYVELFGVERVLVLMFEDLKRDPAGLLDAIAAHIDIDPAGFAQTEVTEVHNHYKKPRFSGAYNMARKIMSPELRQKVLPYGVRKWLNSSPLLYDKSKPTMSREARLFLQNYYQQDIRGLEELLGRNLPDLRKSWI